MRVLLRPVLVPELGLVVVKPGRESMPVFHNTRVLVEPEPKSMRNLPSGVVPAVRQPLVEDKTLLPFFSNARVIRAAGGAGAGLFQEANAFNQSRPAKDKVWVI